MDQTLLVDLAIPCIRWNCSPVSLIPLFSVLSVCLSVYIGLSVCVSFSLCLCLSISLPVCIYACMYVCLSLTLCVCLAIHNYPYMSISLEMYFFPPSPSSSLPSFSPSTQKLVLSLEDLSPLCPPPPQLPPLIPAAPARTILFHMPP